MRFKRTGRITGLTIGALLGGLAGAAGTETLAELTAEGEDRTEEEAAVLAVIDELFAGMQAKDSARVVGTMVDGAVIARVEDDGTTRFTSPEEFAAGLADLPFEPREVMVLPEVRIDGALATVWAAYEFYRGEDYSHCGIDAFQLAKGEAGWKILMIGYSARASCAIFDSP